MPTPNRFWMLVLIISSNLINMVHPQAHCPMHCSTCLPNYIACTTGGLLSIPVQLQPGTEKIVLNSQFQFHGILTSNNFTELAPPRYKIEYISIRSSSIQELRQKTFSQLRYLKFLDFSENQRLTILSSPFDGLKLKQLKLDDIGKLILSSGCFIGLTTEYLSMRNSRLQTLNYDIFRPISYTLKHLFIDNNQIRTLDQRFEPLFYRLESVHLKDNPLICYCPLLWLSKALRSKMMSYKYQGRLEDLQANSVDSNIYPKCVAPSYLRNRQLQSISEAEFNCQIPRISQIEIDLITMQSGEMSCRIQQEEKGHKIPTRIFWQEGLVFGDPFQRVGRTIPTTAERMFSEEGETSGLSATVKIDAINISRKRHFKCIAENTAGKSTLAVQISWPNHNNIVNGSQAVQNSTHSITTSDVTLNSPNLTPESYLFTKHYTLLEMTVAIVGTFLATVLIFLLFYRFYFRKRNGYKSAKESLKYSLNGESPNSNKRSLIAFHGPRGGYTVYETSMHYSDNSQTYDSIPHNSVYPNQQQPLFSTLSNSPSAHFIDYKTHKNLYPSSPCN